MDILDKTIYNHEKFDVSNQLILLPKQKRQNLTQGRIKQSLKLSKTKLKKLDKLKIQKTKREKRRENLTLLKTSNIITKEEYKSIISISSLQTSGKRRIFEPPRSPKRTKEISEAIDVDEPLDLITNDRFILTESKTILDIPNPDEIILETKQPDQEILPTIDSIKAPNYNFKTIHNKPVFVKRKSYIQSERESLPILAEEHEIIDQINHNPVVIICGETGSGKTTQVPQFLYEAGYCEDRRIGITQPRRVAAITLSHRVAVEMNFVKKSLSEKCNLHENSRKIDDKLVSDGTVSYQIRYEGNVKPKTKIKFMTDGILLKEVQSDFLLSDYSVIIIDEAHERTVYTDILIGLLSRIVLLRSKRDLPPLKLIIMSATLRVQDFTENAKLFKFQVPIIKIASKQYPITIHYNIHTPLIDYLEEAYRKVCKIHNQLPAGGILVFMTGRAEVLKLCSMLNSTFKKSSTITTPPLKHQTCTKDVKEENDEKLGDALDERPEDNNSLFDRFPISASQNNVDEILSRDRVKSASRDKTTTINNNNVRNIKNNNDLMRVFPLYSLLNPKRQALVFDYYKSKVPKKCPKKDDSKPENASKNSPLEDSIGSKPRLCVISTNVAETSITIPGIKYVVDCGREKRITFRCVKPSNNLSPPVNEGNANNSEENLSENNLNQVSQTIIGWISKASAAQRAGRCGRTGPGHCYRLYSSAVFNDIFPQFAEPEIRDRPVEDIVLQMKLLNIDRVANFPFPSPPSLGAIRHAEALLCALGLLEPYAGNGAGDDRLSKNKYVDSVTDRFIEGCLANYTPESNLTNKAGDKKVFLITQLGRIVANLPLNPKYGKMIGLLLYHDHLKRHRFRNDKPEPDVEEDQLDFSDDAHHESFEYPISLLPYVLTIACALTVRELFTKIDDDNNDNNVKTSDHYCKNVRSLLHKIPSLQTEQLHLTETTETLGKQEESKEFTTTAASLESLGLGDLMIILKAVGATDYMRINGKSHMIYSFCRTFGVRRQALDEIYRLRSQIYSQFCRPLLTASENPSQIASNNFTRDSRDLLDNFDDSVTKLSSWTEQPDNDTAIPNTGSQSRRDKGHKIMKNVQEDKEYLMMTHPPTPEQIRLLRKIVLSCAGFNLARKIELSSEQKTVIRKYAATQTLADFPSHLKYMESYYQCVYDHLKWSSGDSVGEDVLTGPKIIPAFIHNSSVFSNLPGNGRDSKGRFDIDSEYIIYQEAFISCTRTKHESPDQESTNMIETSGEGANQTDSFISSFDLTRKIYLKSISTIDPAWISDASLSSLCVFDLQNTLLVSNPIPQTQLNNSSPSSNPVVHGNTNPRLVTFDAKDGLVKCQATCYFGPHRWNLGNTIVEYPISIEKYKHFARFFLEGLIFPSLGKFVSKLLLSPDTMLKVWANLQPKTQHILETLISSKIDSKRDLVAVWKNGGGNSNFLLAQYLEWVPEYLHAQVKAIWPPLFSS